MTVELTKEEFEALPEKAQGGFADNGEGVYIPAKDAALKATLDNLDKEKRALEGKVGELTKAEEGRLAELESAKAQARDEAIAEAAKKGNWEQQEKLLREKFEDELNRQRESVRGEVTQEFAVKQATDALAADVKLLSSELAVDESAKAALELLIAQRAKIDESGSRNYFSDDGSALSITELNAFKAELEKSPVLARLIKGKAPSSGGFANGGGNGDGGASNVNAAAEKAKKNGDLNGYLKASLNFKQ